MYVPLSWLQKVFCDHKVFSVQAIYFIVKHNIWRPVAHWQRKLDASNLIELESGSSDLLSKYLLYDFLLLPVLESKESLKNKISYVVWCDNIEQLLLRLSSSLEKRVLVLLSPGWLNKASIVSPVIVQADVRIILSPTVFCILSLAIWEETKYSVVLALLVNSLIIFFLTYKAGK